MFQFLSAFSHRAFQIKTTLIYQDNCIKGQVVCPVLNLKKKTMVILDEHAGFKQIKIDNITLNRIQKKPVRVTPVFALTEAQIKDAYYKSYTYEKMQDYENAINALSSVLNEYQDGYTVNLRMGWLYYLKTNYANSISHYQTAIKAAPSSIEAKLGYLNPLT